MKIVEAIAAPPDLVAILVCEDLLLIESTNPFKIKYFWKPTINKILTKNVKKRIVELIN